MFSRVLTCNSTKFKKKKSEISIFLLHMGGGGGAKGKIFLSPLAEHHTDTRMRTCLAYYIEEK